MHPDQNGTFATPETLDAIGFDQGGFDLVSWSGPDKTDRTPLSTTEF